MPSPEVDIGGGDIFQALVIAAVIVVLDEAVDVRFEIAGQIVVFEQDAVLQGLMPALDLALGLWVMGCAANIQLATTSPNFLILEGIEDWSEFHAEILKSPIRWEAGYVIPLDAPGIGLELNETVVEAHPYDGESLQLKMQDRPA